MKTFDLRPYLLESDLLPVKVDSMIAALVDEGKDESATLEEREATLRGVELRLTQAKRSLPLEKGPVRAAFELGRLAHEIEMQWKMLYCAASEESIEKKLMGVKSAERILQQLYLHKDQGMRHGELAEALGVSDGTLTTNMKRVLQARAATATRYGRNTHYLLTPAGIRYYKKNMDGKDAPSSEGVYLECGDKVDLSIDGLRGKAQIKLLLAASGGDEYKVAEMTGIQEEDSDGIAELNKHMQILSQAHRNDEFSDIIMKYLFYSFEHLKHDQIHDQIYEALYTTSVQIGQK